MKILKKELSPFGFLVEVQEGKVPLSSLDVKDLKKIFEKHHLLLLRGFETPEKKENFSSYCESWGELALWPFGTVLELIEQENPEDHIFDHSRVPLHWDGMYRPEVPEIQIFQCVKAPPSGAGGETTFSHTKKVLERMSRGDYEKLSKIKGNYERKMEFYHSKTEAPLVEKHPFRDYSVIRYSEPPSSGKNFINVPQITFEGGEKNWDWKKTLEKSLFKKENFYAHSWQENDIVIADNHTLLHGRNPFTKGAPRYIRRVHVLGKNRRKNPHLVFHL